MLSDKEKHETHELIMKIDAIAGRLRMEADKLIPIQVNNFGKDILELTGRLREIEKKV